MGLYDRDYTQEGYHSQHHGGPQMRLNFPRLTPVVKWLLIINVSIFIPSFLNKQIGYFFYEWFSVYLDTGLKCLQIWRLITYQFLHDISELRHIFWNMLILFFFGPMLERLWGSKKFLIFYLLCGATGGVLVYSGFNSSVGPLVGASGAILGMLAAGAILFPKMKVLVMFVFPVPLAVMAVVLAVMSILNLFSGNNAGGEAAHLGGMAAGAIYVLSESRWTKLMLKMKSGQWEKKIDTQQNLQFEVDRILQKVYNSGIHSLTKKEKKTLKRATHAQQTQNKP